MSAVTPERIEGIADGLAQAWRTGKAWLPAGGFDDALGIADAYRIQDAVAERLGWFAAGRPAAWKGGGKAQMTAAPLPAVLPSGSTWSSFGSHELGMEAEVAFRLGRTPTSADDILPCIATMCVTIELVGTRLAGGFAAPLAWRLADQQVHGGLVAGTEIPFSPRDWTAHPFSVTINGKVHTKKTGSHPSGDALYPLPWLEGHARDRHLALQAGDLITTGAWAVIPVAVGDAIVVEFPGIGTASVSIG